MKFDRKLVLIAPTIVLALVVAGMIYAVFQIRILGDVSETLAERREFIAQVKRGEKPLEARQALNIIDAQFEVEGRRSAALGELRSLLSILAGIGFVSVVVLAIGVRGVERKHWPGARRREVV